MNIKIITASAGTGKTYRLATELDDAIASGRARPDSLVATTFTTQAAAELIERARTRLLQSGRSAEAQQLLAARIGTVNAVCGSLVSELAFELGLSPAVRILDEAAAAIELKRSLGRVVTDARATELDRLRSRFEAERDWRLDVRLILEAARANGLGAAELRECAARSCRELDVCLGPRTAVDLDGALRDAIATAIAAIGLIDDETKGTARYLQLLRTAAKDLGSARGPTWGTWALLGREKPTKRSLGHAIAVQQVALQHVSHPRLRRELHSLVTNVFEIAADALAAYQDHKRARGLLDFVDQEAHALALLRRPHVRSALDGQLDLVLVDEFQDTSPIQLALFLELASLARESIWVGDPKQAIFGFRGTDPALMDLAIEGMTSTTSDPELAELVSRSAGHQVETLSTSYRSRPALVGLTNAIFAPAFARHGILEERTCLKPKLNEEPAGLGVVLEHWPLELDRRDRQDNEGGRADSVAAGIRELLDRAPLVRERVANPEQTLVRGARPGDVAVLCRTNKQCQAVAHALGRLGVAVVVPRMRLLTTPEAQVACAGLALWVDPGDALAAAELARIIAYPTDLDGFVARVLETPGRDAFRSEPTVARLLAAREAAPDLGPVAALEAVIDATELRDVCAAWGNTSQRLANLDALRAHATMYTSEAAACSRAATLTGLLHHLDQLAPRNARWDRGRTDRQAVPVGDDAVTVLTWHRAKGLEWPITVLFGLESLRTPSSFGVHVTTDHAAFDVTDPLAGRWIRYWPNPYTTPSQHGPVRQAVERTAAHSALVATADREALRVLYVGWTRARDRVILAAKRGCLLDGLLEKLVAIDPRLIDEPPPEPSPFRRACWAGIEVPIEVWPARPAPAVAAAREPGLIHERRAPTEYPRARATPSGTPPVSCTLGELVTLGARIEMSGKPDMEAVGDAIHAFFAADRDRVSLADRLALADSLLASYGVASHLPPHSTVEMADRLWKWIAATFPKARVHREWPLAYRDPRGTVVAGTADLVLLEPQRIAVIDHKSFPGTTEAAGERALGYSGQLHAYASALRAAHDKAISTWIHFPIRGRLVEVRLQ